VLASRYDDGVQGSVEGSVAAAVEPVPDDLPRRRGSERRRRGGRRQTRRGCSLQRVLVTINREVLSAPAPSPAPIYDAVLFDLFTALLDSQPLWREVAGNAAVGARWREECSRLAYSAGTVPPAR
jgi:hypothetical protein